MRAAERDAKREEARRLRPKGKREKTSPKSEVKCSGCGFPMGHRTGVVTATCSNCIARNRQLRGDVEDNRREWVKNLLRQKPDKTDDEKRFLSMLEGSSTEPPNAPEDAAPEENE